MKPIRIATLVVLGAVVVALAGVARPDFAGGAAGTASKGVTVTGLGTVKAVPDSAEFNLGVKTDGKTAREALDANSKQMRRVLAVLDAAGIPKADVKTQEVSVSPGYAEDGHPSGYTARNSVSVLIQDFAKSGQVLDAATKAGANEVYGPSLTRSDREQLEASALKAAVENARTKAQALAEAAGMRLGSVTAITEGFDRGAEPLYAEMRMADSSSQAPIRPGTEDIEETVTVTFAFA